MKKLAFLPIFILLAGCAVGPNYKRPTVNLPTDYRAAAPAQSDSAASLGNEKWWDVYQDPVLAQLIHTALQQNYDVRIVATRVLEAQAQLGITRANQLPSASSTSRLSGILTSGESTAGKPRRHVPSCLPRSGGSKP
jgi:multidrug efflux system outer membrane protein